MQESIYFKGHKTNYPYLAGLNFLRSLWWWPIRQQFSETKQRYPSPLSSISLSPLHFLLPIPPPSTLSFVLSFSSLTLLFHLFLHSPGLHTFLPPPVTDQFLGPSTLTYVFRVFSLHIFAYTVHILSSVLSTRPDKLVEVPPTPVGETFLKQSLLLLQLLLGEWLRRVYSLLFLLLPLLWVFHVHIQWHSVVD